MTDKQIIIDEGKFEKAENEPINQEAVNKFIKETDKFYVNDVDVSWCNLYRDEVSFIGGETIKDVCSIWIWQRDYSGLEPGSFFNFGRT